MNIFEWLLVWLFRLVITLLAAYGLAQLFVDPDYAVNFVRFLVFGVFISVGEVMLLIWMR